MSELFTLGPALQQVDRTWVLFRQRRLIYFGGCDYYRLASHPAVELALCVGLKGCGLNVSASRLTTGNHALYERLEKKLARFFGVERAALVASGYLGNLVAAQALAGAVTHAFIDERAHASLQDATAFLGCPVTRFPHCDPAGLAAVLAANGAGARPLVLTDGLFAQDGSVAPVREYLRQLPARGLLLVDEAHAAGVLGRRGRGAAEHSGTRDPRLVQTMTLSKAFGTYGGAVLGTQSVVVNVIQRSRLFAGNTPLPLPLAAAAIMALELVRTDQAMRVRLAENVAYTKWALGSAGLPVGDSPSPILTFTPAKTNAADRLKRRLLAHGVYPCFIRYPGGPAQGSFRFALSSEHTRGQLDRLIAALTTAS